MGGSYKINVIMETRKKCPENRALIDIAKKTLEIEGARRGTSLNLLLTDDKMIRRLNKRFLGRDAPTDVIAFGAKGIGAPNKPFHSVCGMVKGFIGEAAISVEQAGHNARQFNTSREREIFLYVIHGILHLLGYRDDTRSQMRIMEGRQDKILREVLCASS